MQNVKEILDLVESPSKSDVVLVEKSFNFSKEAHKDHTRYSGEPFFNHLCETARGLAELGMDATTIAAGLLHDSMEDVGIKEEDIEREFGKDVLFLVQGVTKLGALKYRGHERHAESLRKLLVATSQDVRVVIIKLIDRLHNMKTLSHVPKAKQKRIALETLEIYAPIADRLGMGKIRGELADLAFPFVYPKEYTKVRELLKERAKIRLKHLEKIRKDLATELGKQGIRTFRTDFRVKHLYSLYKKLERKDWGIEKIHDISALRVIVPSVDLCYRILGIIHSLWRPIPGKIKDYIAFPKPNGYRSLHTSVLTGDASIVEIQIRTEAMHRDAEYGIASHFSYKESVDEQRKAISNIAWLRQLIPPVANLIRPSKNAKQGVMNGSPNIPSWIRQIAETQRAESKSEDFMEDMRSDFFTNRVFVFTPKGDVIDLPAGSTPIDFAYAIHSDIGDHTASARVNGKMTSLDSVLNYGDIIEIITKESAHPSAKWIEFARTALAKRQIRSALSPKIKK